MYRCTCDVIVVLKVAFASFSRSRILTDAKQLRSRDGPETLADVLRYRNSMGIVPPPIGRPPEVLEFIFSSVCTRDVRTYCCCIQLLHGVVSSRMSNTHRARAKSL